MRKIDSTSTGDGWGAVPTTNPALQASDPSAATTATQAVQSQNQTTLQVAAAKILPAPPIGVPMIAQNGLITPVWAEWFRKLQMRSGGDVSFSSDDLAVLEAIGEVDSEAMGLLQSRLGDLDGLAYPDAFPPAQDVLGALAGEGLFSVPRAPVDTDLAQWQALWVPSPSTISQVGTITSGVWQGTVIGVKYGGTGADLSGTGGSSKVVMQTSAGAAFTVAQLAASDLSNTTTGSNKVVLDTSPTLVTPVLGVATATSINKVALTAPATSATVTVADGKTFTCSNTLTFTGTDSAGLTLTGAYTTTLVAPNSASYTLNGATATQIPTCIYTGVATTTISNAGPTSIFTTGTAGSTLTIPSAFLNVAGATVIVEAEGTYSSGSATPTIAVVFKHGSTTLATISATATSASISSKPFKIRAVLTIRTPGATASVAAHVDYYAIPNQSTVNSMGADSTSATPDTTASSAIDVQVTTAAGTGTTSVVLTQQRVYLLGV